MSTSEVTVPAGGRSRVDVTLSFDPTAAAPLIDTVQTASGLVTFTPSDAGDQPAVRVPYLQVVDPVSDITTDLRRLTRDTAHFRSVNTSRIPGSIDVYALGLTDTQDGGGTTDVRAAGVQAFPGADIGVFAINLWEPVSTASVNEWDVLLDIDDDGTFDYAVIGLDLFAVLAGFFGGDLGSFLVDLETGSVISAFFAAGDLDSGTVLLPFVLSDAGIDASNPDFDYVSGVFSLVGGTDDVFDGVASFDAFDQPVETGILFGLGGNEALSWQASRDRNNVLGWMLVELEDRAGPAQTELIELRN